MSFAVTHGMRRAPEYNVWNQLVQRCTNQDHKQYSDYGGRGITVCERWLKFENFIADMGRRPSPRHSIDRAQNAGGYEPGNCRWATPKEQGRNKRNNHLLTLDGVTRPVVEWVEITCIKRTTILMRLSKYGWTVREALGVDRHVA